MTKEDWELKDRRIVRQACVKAAANLFKGVSQAHPDMEITAGMVVQFAEVFERYVYKEDECHGRIEKKD